MAFPPEGPWRPVILVVMAPLAAGILYAGVEAVNYYRGNDPLGLSQPTPPLTLAEHKKTGDMVVNATNENWLRDACPLYLEDEKKLADIAHGVPISQGAGYFPGVGVEKCKVFIATGKIPPS